MKVTSVRLLPDIASLNLDTTKNSNILHANKSSLIGLSFLQGSRTCNHLWHADPKSPDTEKKQTTKNGSFLEYHETDSRRSSDQCQYMGASLMRPM
jgi:hypothetical protein